MSFFKLVLSFAPWLAFLGISHFGLMGLKIGLVAGLQRGIILWCGLAFFSCMGMSVIGFASRWAEMHVGMLANAALATGAWGGIVIRRSFSADYGRAHTPPDIWRSPRFIRANNIITAVWAAVFSLNAAGLGVGGCILRVPDRRCLVHELVHGQKPPGS
jgi:hypothetical protein